MNNSSEGLCKKSWEPETTFNQQGFGKKIYLMLGNPVFLKKIRFRKVEISDDEKSCVCRKIASHTQQSVTGGAGTMVDQTVKHTNKTSHNTVFWEMFHFPENEPIFSDNFGEPQYAPQYGGTNI